MQKGHSAEVYLRLDLEFVPVAQGPLIEVRAAPMGVMGCQFDSSYRVTRGSGRNGRHTTTRDLKMPMGGRFVWAAGHMHDGGLMLRLRDQTRGRNILTSRAMYGLQHDRWYLTGATIYSRAPGYLMEAGCRAANSGV